MGILKTARGELRTPFFMPVATRGAVKHIAAAEMKRPGAEILLANAYHLMLRPGEKLIKKAGGLHKFMDWQGPILTDSGGFQIFSLAGKKRKGGRDLVKLAPNGVRFKSHLDGREYYLTPERSLKIQADLGVDIAVCLDECVALPAEREYVAGSVARTTSWAEKTKKYYLRMKGKKPLLFCVAQGGLDRELRMKSLSELAAIGFDGYNIGGLSVGESADEMYGVLDYLCPAMPADRPRYLMGVGYPEQIVEAVKRGVDMFDCVIPTREGRHGRLFLFCHSEARTPPAGGAGRRIPGILGRRFGTININRSQFARDFSPINAESKLPELRNLTKAYLHHLFKCGEPLGARLASLNNLEFYLGLMASLRRAIRSGAL